MTGVVPTAGTKLYIGTTGSLDSESSWTEIGEVVNFGEFGRKYELIKFNPVGDRETQKFKGARDDGSLQLTVGRVPEDTGQSDALDALDSDDKYNFKIELNDNPGGTGAAPTTFKFKGLVMSYTANVGSVNNVVQSSLQIEISGDIEESAPVLGSA